MKKLLIVGAGGFGREIYAWAKQHLDCGRIWEIAGFLDDDLSALNAFNYPAKIIGTVEGHQPTAEEIFVCAIGVPAIKKKVCQKLLSRSAVFIAFAHPSLILGENVELGCGVILCPRVTLTSDISIGSFVTVNCHSTVGHDAVIGDWSTISAHCDLTGHTTLGEGVFFGSGARIIPGKSVGDGAVVGAGAVVIRSVGTGEKVFGNPARVFD